MTLSRNANTLRAYARAWTRVQNLVLSRKQIAAQIVTMRPSLRAKATKICEDKLGKKGANVGLSFYAFFANKNDDPALLMEAAEWWILTHELDHFEKAAKIRQMILSGV